MVGHQPDTANLRAKGCAGLWALVAGLVTLIASNSLSPMDLVAQAPEDKDSGGAPPITQEGPPQTGGAQ